MEEVARSSDGYRNDGTNSEAYRNAHAELTVDRKVTQSLDEEV